MFKSSQMTNTLKVRSLAVLVIGLIGAEALAKFVDFRTDCRTNLSMMGIASKHAAGMCEYVETFPPETHAVDKVNRCPKLLKEHEEIMASETQATEVCGYLHAYQLFASGSRNACIENLITFRTPQGHPALSDGEFVVNDGLILEKLTVSAADLAVHTCVANSDAQINCALGNLEGVNGKDPSRPATSQTSSYLLTSLIDWFWDTEGVNGKATLAFSQSISLCQRIVK
jgi:hypothetical protein